MCRIHLVVLILFAGLLPGAVETIKPSEAFALLAHCRRHATGRTLPFNFVAEVMLRTEHLLNVSGTFDGTAITLVPLAQSAQDLGPGDELLPEIVVFNRLVINLTRDGTGIDDMIASGPKGTTRIVFKPDRLFEHIADPYGNVQNFDYALADSELYSISDHGGPGPDELLANPGGGGGGGSAAPGAGDNAESGNFSPSTLIIPFGGVVSPTS